MSPGLAPSPRILVIKLAALGDVVQAFGPFQAIRDAHPDAHITLLTTKIYADFLKSAPWFDDIWVDTRPKALAVGAWIALRKRLMDAEFSRVYDVQTSDRSSGYHRLFWPGPRPEWSGIARGCSHPHTNPNRDHMHTLDRQRDQLQMAGLTNFPEADLNWLQNNGTSFDIAGDYALIVAGGSADRPRKRWPVERFAALCQHLMARGITPVLIGGKADQNATALIAKATTGVRDLTDQTTLSDIYMLARSAKVSVGNDTGPMHLIAKAGCATVVLFSDDSNPSICAPRGDTVCIEQEPDLIDLSEDRVWRVVQRCGGLS